MVGDISLSAKFLILNNGRKSIDSKDQDKWFKNIYFIHNKNINLILEIFSDKVGV